MRLVKVDRGAAAHALHDLTVEVQLQGDFGPAHTAGDNSQVLPTDTMKNTVYALARQGPVDPPEEFGERLARHFLHACPAARRAVLGIAVNRWDRASVKDAPHDHVFVQGTAERRLATVTVDEMGVGVEAALEGMGLLKTTGSGFAGFLRDELHHTQGDRRPHSGDRCGSALEVRASATGLYLRLERRSHLTPRDVRPAPIGLGAADVVRHGRGSAGSGGKRSARSGSSYQTGITCWWTCHRSGWTIRTRYSWRHGSRTAGSRR